MAIVVATAPNNYPTPSDTIWGHELPSAQKEVDFALIAVAALLFGVSAASRYRSRRTVAGIAAWLLSGFVLLALSILIWRLHAPVSAGNGV
jgi:hypothetical protein